MKTSKDEKTMYFPRYKIFSEKKGGKRILPGYEICFYVKMQILTGLFFFSPIGKNISYLGYNIWGG